MAEFIQILIFGLAAGTFYAVNALGMVVVFRASGVVNFAAGSVAMFGGYAGWLFADEWEIPHALAVPMASLVGGLASILVYALAVKWLEKASTLAKVIATLALSISLQQIIAIRFGTDAKLSRPFLPQTNLRYGSIFIGNDTLIVVAFTVVLTLALWVIYRFTKFGVATSALSENPLALAGLGWKIGRLRAANWFIGGLLAGLVGASLGPFLTVHPLVFSFLLVPTLAAAVFGGLRSFPLTLAGGLFVGAAESLARRYVEWTGAERAVGFVVIIAFLALRGRSLPLRSFVQERLPRVGSGRPRHLVLVVAVLAAALVSTVIRESLVAAAIVAAATAIILLSQVVITGYAGQLSLAQQTMGGLSALVAANLAVNQEWPFLVCLVVGVLATIPISLLVALPSLRARGVSLAIATLGFAVALDETVLKNTRFTNNQSNGLLLGDQKLFGWSIEATEHPWRYLMTCVGAFALLGLGVAKVRRGAAGRRMLAVRTNERAAAAMGINVATTKLFAFTLAGAIAGVGGVLLAFKDSVPQFASFDPVLSLANLVSAVLGGIGYIGGALFGGAVGSNTLPDEILRPLTKNLPWWNNAFLLAIGLLVVAQLRINANGVADGIAHPPGGKGRGSKRGGRTSRREVAEQSALERAMARPRTRRPATLHVRDVVVAFGPVVAVDAVSITVSPGEVLGVIGPNGAGKTTLIDAITGFVPMRGTIELDGTRIESWPAHRRCRAGLSRAFQSLELLEDMTVLDNLRCAADGHGLGTVTRDLFTASTLELSAATAEAIQSLGLGDVLDKLPSEISYGDRRLLAVARALAADPAVLLLDEPAAGLGPAERTQLSELIRTIARVWNVGVLLVEHDIELVRRSADRVIALDFGQTIVTGTPDEVFSHADVITSYLGRDLTDRPDNPDLDGESNGAIRQTVLL